MIEDWISPAPLGAQSSPTGLRLPNGTPSPPHLPVDRGDAEPPATASRAPASPPIWPRLFPGL